MRTGKCLSLLCVGGSLAVLLATGCGQAGPGRYDLAGSVTHDGQPLPYGYIHFTPDSQRGNRGPGSGAPVRDGKYATPPGKGIVGGPYVVRIAGSDGVAVEVPGEGLNEAGMPLFADYTERVQFPNEDSVHDFAIPKQPPRGRR